MPDCGESLSEELERLVREFRAADAGLLNEAWNLLADFTEANAEALIRALKAQSQ